MELFKELDISLEKNELISIIGGGGKTTSMFRLGKELTSRGKTVLITTTTAIFKPEEGTYERILVLEDKDDYKHLKGSITGVTVLGSKILRDKNKLIGVDKEVIDEIFESKIFDYIIVEADGSKRKPIKAPASHEPVIPSLTTKAIGLIGLDCVGKKLYEENVHRADILASVTNSKLGDIIDEKIIYNLIISKNGIFKSVPAHSKKYIVLNKAETKERKRVAEKVRYKITLSRIEIDKIIIGSMRGY